MVKKIEQADVVVIGAGPGGYVAALHAADLGKQVVLIEERERLGGTCLLDGCIPSKALIHAVEVIETAKNSGKLGITFSGIKFDLDTLRQWSQSVVSQLSQGISALCRQRQVLVVRGRARLQTKFSLLVDNCPELEELRFNHCILATGSRINQLPDSYHLPLWHSAEALQLPKIPARLLVIGGGYIGLEMGLVYAGLGSQVTLVSLAPRLLGGADPDLVKVVLKNCEKKFSSLLLGYGLEKIEQVGERFLVTVLKDGEKQILEFDQVLCAIGRKPNTESLGLEQIGLGVNRQGLIETGPDCRTIIPHIYAIGDITPGPTLAHKASREAKVAAEIIAGQPAAFDNPTIPAVVFTDPEISWVGLTEQEAASQGRPVKIGRFPLSALGRTRTLGRSEGLVKVLADPQTELLLGVGAVGPLASELISEATLAIEMGATLEDLLATIHPHPTMSEALMEAAEMAAGGSVHVARSRKGSNAR